MNEILGSGLGPVAITDSAPINKSINKHGSVTQVKNGFIFYAGGDTFVAYSFEELVEHLKEYFTETV